MTPPSVYAEHHAGEGKSFEEHKTMMTQKIDKKIANLNEAKTCVQGAKDKEALKACHEKMREQKKEMKKEWKDKKKDKKKK